MNAYYAQGGQPQPQQQQQPQTVVHQYFMAPPGQPQAAAQPPPGQSQAAKDERNKAIIRNYYEFLNIRKKSTAEARYEEMLAHFHPSYSSTMDGKFWIDYQGLYSRWAQILHDSNQYLNIEFGVAQNDSVSGTYYFKGSKWSGRMRMQYTFTADGKITHSAFTILR